MKTVNVMAAQGDILLRKVATLPEGVTERPATGGRHVVAHSETGHDHYLEAPGVTFYTSKDPLVGYLRIDGAWGDVLHARSFDTHETLRLTPGVWEVRRQREMTPEGWAQVTD